MFKLVRTGYFNAYIDGDYHCGVKTSPTKPLVVLYAVTVECMENSLDVRDFLFDQFLIENYFKKIELGGKHYVSCECLAKDAANGILDEIHFENSFCKVAKIYATLSPKPYVSSVTYILEEI